MAEARGVMGTRLLGFGEAEALRAEAGLWLRRGERDRARACLREARALAEAQGARALELRALAELVALDGDGEPAAALRALYRGLAEGHALADLDDARAQLAALPCARNVEAAEAYVLGRLRAELSPRLTYHDLAHTRDDVVPAVKRLAARQRRSARELELVVTAAWFHDLGFIECRDGHEQVGIRIAREVLPALGYAADDLAAIAAIIEATRLPQTPTSELAELLADADLDVLGRPDFFVKNERLRAELIAAGRDVPLATWRLDQHAFVQRHRYFTAVARELRDAGKRANAEAIAAAIAADAAAEPGPR